MRVSCHVQDDVIRIATAAVDRLTDKLSGAADRREIVDMEEEFRLLTLQVIGEAILGLPHEECDEVLSFIKPPQHSCFASS
jgi:beta-ring hydroxylase